MDSEKQRRSLCAGALRFSKTVKKADGLHMNGAMGGACRWDAPLMVFGIEPVLGQAIGSGSCRVYGSFPLRARRNVFFPTRWSMARQESS